MSKIYVQNRGRLLSLTFLYLFTSAISGQSDNISESQNKDSISSDKGSSHSLYGGAGFVSNLVYMGTSISQDKPVYSGSITYGYKDRLFISAASFHLPAFSPFLSFHAFTVSYSQVINSWFDISGGISRYQVAPSLTDTLFNNFVYGNMAIGFDWKILYTNLSAGGIFSDESSAYLQIRNSRYFQTSAINNSNLFFSFDPYVNMLFGSLTKTETSEGTIIGISKPFSSGGRSGNHSSQTYSTFFGLMEIDCGIPVSLNGKKFTLEAEPGYVIPFYSDTEAFNPKGFIFMLNFYIKIL